MTQAVRGSDDKRTDDTGKNFVTVEGWPEPAERPAAPVEDSRGRPAKSDPVGNSPTRDPDVRDGKREGGSSAGAIDLFADTGEGLPLGDNPFLPDHPAYGVFEEATWEAKAEIGRLQLEFLILAQRDELLNSILKYRARYFNVVAKTGIRIVGNEETALRYEVWVDDSARFHLADAVSWANRKAPGADVDDPPFFSAESLKSFEGNLALELKRMASHYKSEVASVVLKLKQSRRASGSPSEEAAASVGTIDSTKLKPPHEPLPTSGGEQGSSEGFLATPPADRAKPRRRHGFAADMDRHSAIAEIVDRHAPRWRENFTSWKVPNILRAICRDLDAACEQSGMCEIPGSWKAGKPESLGGTKVKSWSEAEELAPRKLVIAQIKSSLSMVRKHELSRPRDCG